MTIDATNRYAEGALGSARNCADSLQYIGCWVENGVVNCGARNSGGLTVNCSSSASAIVSAANAMASDAHILFRWNTSGACTSLMVSKYSSHAPKNP